MNFLKRFFGKNVDLGGPTQMRIERLDQWLETKFLPRLEVTIHQLKTNVESCQSYSAELKEATQWKHDEVEKFKARLRDGPAYEKRADDYTEQ